MFKGEDEHRTLGQNAALAGSLASVAGMVNTLGFMKEGVFTSHVTGEVGQLSVAISLHLGGDALRVTAQIVLFFLGAFVACIALEGVRWRKKPYVYSALLLIEASMLVVVLLNWNNGGLNRLALCAAMGIQNGLVTRLSGAVVRTTHLTGVVTDLGIETARWVLTLASRLGVVSLCRRLLPAPATAPNSSKTLLLLTIFAGFFGGGGLAGLLFVEYGTAAFFTPIILLLIGGALAFRNGMESLGPESRQ